MSHCSWEMVVGGIALRTNEIILKKGSVAASDRAGGILVSTFSGIWLENNISRDLFVIFLWFWHI